MNAIKINKKSKNILIVDDIEAKRKLLQDQMKTLGYYITQAENGLSALAQMTLEPPDVVLLDINMPEMNGFEVIEQMKMNPVLNNIPIIVISALSDVEDIIRCIKLGADDFLTKPHNIDLLNARVENHIEKKELRDREQRLLMKIEEYNLNLEDKVRQQVKETGDAQRSVIFAMSKLVESRDQETGAHLERIREYCKLLVRKLATHQKFASQINEKFIEDLYASSPLHDIGKVGMPDRILLKPGKLTSEERKIMNSHTLIGAETLRAVDENHPGNSFIKMGIEITESHHEKWDGSGYPYGLKADKIPLSSRILSLADFYDALTTDRPYRKALEHSVVRDMIISEANKHFDPYIVDVFIEIENEFIHTNLSINELIIPSKEAISI